MKRLPLPLTILLLFAPGIAGQDLKLTATKKVVVEKQVAVEAGEIVDSFPLIATAPEGGILYQWQYPAGVQALRKGRVLEIASAPKGSLTIGVQFAVIDFDARKVEEKYLEISVVVGKGPEPGPGPGPKPDPDPPGPVTGLRVILIRETGDNSTTKEQLNTIYSPRIAAYLNQKCKDGVKGWRRWDIDQKVESETDLWKNLWAAVKPKVPSLPAIAIVTDQSGEVFPLPATEAETLELLKKYGG